MACPQASYSPISLFLLTWTVPDIQDEKTSPDRYTLTSIHLRRPSHPRHEVHYIQTICQAAFVSLSLIREEFFPKLVQAVGKIYLTIVRLGYLCDNWLLDWMGFGSAHRGHPRYHAPWPSPKAIHNRAASERAAGESLSTFREGPFAHLRAFI